MSHGPLAPTVERNAREAEGRRYAAEGGKREIAKDRRIKPNEGRLIHALLRRRGIPSKTQR